jgi:hypothetical protein
MNDLTEFQNHDISYGDSPLGYYHPIEVLWHINPEIATLAYANRTGWLSSEIAPHLARFRECQTQEKIAILRSIVDKLAINADERKTELIERTREKISLIEKEGLLGAESIKANASIETQSIKSRNEKEAIIGSESIKAKALVESQGIKSRYEKETILGAESIKATSGIEMELIRAQTALDVQKIKYETARYVLEQHVEGQKYLSDNQLEATRIEAEALRDMIISSEQIRAAAQDRTTEANLVERITSAEYQYLSRIQEAEIVRQGREYENNATIAQSYLFAQAIITRSALSYELAKKRAAGLVDQASYQALADIAKEGVKLLARDKVNKITFRGRTKHGEVRFEIEKKDGPK